MPGTFSHPGCYRDYLQFVFAVKERRFLIAKENKEELPELNAVISAEQVI